MDRQKNSGLRWWGGKSLATRSPLNELAEVQLAFAKEQYQFIGNQYDKVLKPSLVVATVGLVLIAAGLAVGVFYIDESMVLPGLFVGSGISILVVSATFLVSIARTISETRPHQHALADAHSALISLTIAEKIDGPKRDELLATVVRQLNQRPLLGARERPPTPRW